MYTLFQPKEKVTINVYSNYVILSKEVRALLEDPEYIRVFFDEENNQMALKAYVDSRAAFRIAGDRICSKDLVERIGKTGRIAGEYNASEDMVVFNLNG